MLKESGENKILEKRVRGATQSEAEVERQQQREIFGANSHSANGRESPVRNA